MVCLPSDYRMGVRILTAMIETLHGERLLLFYQRRSWLGAHLWRESIDTPFYYVATTWHVIVC